MWRKVLAFHVWRSEDLRYVSGEDFPMAELPLILIVDDDEGDRAALRKALEGSDYRVVEAASGPEAFERIEAEPPDCILLDVAMPGLSGLELCDLLSSRSQTRGIPVILTSPSTRAEGVAEGLAHGANDFVTKPVEPIELRARIGAQLRIKHLQDELKERVREILELQRLREEFVAMVTHDMKAPLTVILGQNRLLEEGCLGPMPGDAARQALRSAIRSCRRLIQYINDFLDITRLESGRLEIRSDPVDIAALIRDVYEAHSPVAEEEGLKMTLELSEKPLPTVMGDYDQLVRALRT